MAEVLEIELVGCFKAICEGIEVVAEKGGPIGKLARKLVAAGFDGDTPVEVWRGTTLCFKPVPLWKWAETAIVENDSKDVRFVKYRPFGGMGG